MHVVRLADDYAHVVREIDPRLDDFEYVNELYESAGVPCPKTLNLKWHLNFLDLGLLDATLNTFFVFRYGPN